MLLTVNKIGTKVSGVVGNEKYSLPYAAESYQALLDLEKEFDSAKTMDEASAVIVKAGSIVANANIAEETQLYGDNLVLDKNNGRFYLITNGVRSSIPLPKTMADRIIESVEKEISFLPVVKAWIWLLKNKNFSVKLAERFAQYINSTYVDKEVKAKYIEEGLSEDKATELATFYDVAITKNGLISAYKYAQINATKFDTTTGETVPRYGVVYDEETGIPTVQLPANAEDYSLLPPVMGKGGDAFYCGAELGHTIQVGQIHRLPDWSYVDKTNDVMNKGLWLGGYTYVHQYGGNDRLLLNAFVNPMNIGSFYKGAQFSAIKCLEYYVHSACFAPNKQLYHESEYLSHSNSQWDTLKAEAVEESEKAIAALKTKQAELNAL